jgi:DNA (cytosine-5)-methyltransferase 1
MSWLYSQALVEEYLGDICSDGEPSVQSNGNPTQQAYCAPDRMTKFSRLSRFGMTYKPLTEDRGEELLTSYLAAFPVRTSAPQERAQELTESDPGCGHIWQELLARYDPATSLWKTPQCSLLEDSIEFSGTWPRWGSMRDGVSYQQQTLVPHTEETEFGLLPDGKNFFHTPNTTGMDGGSNSRKALKKRQETWPTPAARDGNSTNTLETLMDGRFVDQLANRVKMVENNLWTTPCSRDWKGKTITKNHPEGFNKSLANDVIKSTTTPDSPNSGKLNPTWVEWLMGWPLGWTDLKPLEMDKYQQWRQQHGVSSSEEA